MCTVTFIPSRDNIFITSNRDEKNSRGPARPPAVYQNGGQRMIYPRDADAGGTWISMKENGDAAVLLNGAFIAHIAEPPYLKSRGLLFLDIFGTERPSQAFFKMNLYGIEPFTFVLYEKNCLYEFRWDGTERYGKQLALSRPHIWSSATLYDGLTVKKREQWFAAFLNRHPNPTQLDILNFHRFSGEGDSSNDLLMKRENLYATVSITGIMLNNDRGSMKYLAMEDNKMSEMKIELVETPGV